MMTFRDGAVVSKAGGKAMAEYLLAGTLRPENTRAAQYYTGSEAAASKTRAFWDTAVEQGRSAMGETVAELRPDLSQAMAERLGIADRRKPLTVDGIANLLNLTRLDGGEIEGRKKHSPSRSLADTFGLNAGRMPAAEEIRNILAGKRADGGAPLAPSGGVLPAKDVERARARFKTAIEIPKDREATAEEMVRLEGGLTATGRALSLAGYRKRVGETNPPVGYKDLTLSADKSLSVAWALAPTAAERDTILNIHREAVAETMAYVQTQLGFVRRGAGGCLEEQAELGWVAFQHYTARPAVEIERQDDEGKPYTETREVRTELADPQLHTHVLVLNTALTENGHAGAVDHRRLHGRVKEFGAAYQAIVARRARALGIEVALDRRTGAARLTAVPESMLRGFSKRTREAERAGEDVARRRGLNWRELDGEQKVALVKAGAIETKQAKEGGKNDFAGWHEQAQAASYRHRSVLRRAVASAVEDDVRYQAAYRVAMPLLADRFNEDVVLDAQELREIALRGLTAAGIGDRIGADIDAVVKLFDAQGVMQDGVRVRLLRGEAGGGFGQERIAVTTTLHVEQERELIGLAKAAVADMRRALPTSAINAAAGAFLKRTPTIDPEGAQWQGQHEVMTRLATGGQLGVAIGVAGAGKTTLVAPMVDAWKVGGREVVGITLANRHGAELRAAGITEVASVAAFLNRVKRGKLELSSSSVVVVDEVSMLGTRHMLQLLRIQEKTGAQIVMLGDPKQCNSVVGGPGLELLRLALGEAAIPQILTSVRQHTDREREIAGLWRAGRADEALEMKQEDGTAVLVAGGREATVRHVARLWRERLEANAADPDYKLTISAPTNGDARDVGAAIRAERREAGQIGETARVLDAIGRDGERYRLPVSIGDRVRLFERVYDRTPMSPRSSTPSRTSTPRRRALLANNGDSVEILALNRDGMRVRNDAGTEGIVEWRKIQSKPGAPVRLGYGYAMTIDTAQGHTAAEHILAMPSGSGGVNGFKAYVGGSRHRRANFIVIDEASERRQIAGRAMLGHRPEIHERDIWANIGDNLSRQPQKASAIYGMRREARL